MKAVGEIVKDKKDKDDDVNKNKFYFTLIIIFWSTLIISSSLGFFNPILGSIGSSLGLDIIGLDINLESNQKLRYIEDSNNGSCQFNIPSERTIIFRLDDIQDYVWRDIAINITDDILKRNMSITLGVIPESIGKDNKLKKYLLDKVRNPRIEIVQHGLRHSYFEFRNISENDAYNSIDSGRKKIVDTLGIYPITFIPPNNEYNQNTTTALSELGFKIVSAKEGEYKSEGNLSFIGLTKQTKEKEYDNLSSIDYIKNGCDISFGKNNLCVINVHPQDYANKDGSINNDLYIEFIKLLDELEKMNVKFNNFKDNIKCDNIEYDKRI